MSWMRVDGDLPGHPKLKRLALLTGVDPETLLGKLVSFWGWIQKYAEDGDISRFDPAEIALAFNLPAGPETLKHLIASGFIDSFPYLRIHDWWEYNGMWLRAKYKRSPVKWKRVKRLYSAPNPARKNVTGTVTGTVPCTDELRTGDVTPKRTGRNVVQKEPLTPPGGGALASPENKGAEPAPGPNPNGATPRQAGTNLRALGISLRAQNINPRALGTDPRTVRRKAIELRVVQETIRRRAEDNAFVYDMSVEEMAEITRRNFTHAAAG